LADAVGARAIGFVGISLCLTAPLSSCSTATSDLESVESAISAPVVFVPGLGMSALRVHVEQPDITFDFLVPAMNPATVLPASAVSALDYSIDSGLPVSQVDSVAPWLSLSIDADGEAHNQPGVAVEPVSFGSAFATECPRYVPFAEDLESRGWKVDDTLRCAPFDYRYPPGENSFASNLTRLVNEIVAEADDAPVVLACHSQGCLMALHALRTLDREWVRANIRALFGFAGQFSGCSDCLRWAFQPGWSWDPTDPDASPVDPTWVGELALDLQTSVYGDEVLYRNGSREYRAPDVGQLLIDAGSTDIARATKRYSLQRQTWFMKGNELEIPLAVPARFVYGSGIPTVIGYDFTMPNTSSDKCASTACIGSFAQKNPAQILADGDGGDSSFMNRAPTRWTIDVSCDIKEMPGVSHMDIVTTPEAIDLLERTATGHGSTVACLD